MSRIIAVAAAAVVALSLTACAAGPHSGTAGSPRPHPAASHASAAAIANPTPTATPSAAPAPAARLSTSPGDELLTFSGTGHSTDGSVVAVTFTVHAPVAWNSPAGTSTLAALAAAHTALGGIVGDDLRNSGWDAANAASLAVVDYSATMTSGSWHPGEAIEIDLGPAISEVALNADGVAIENGWSTLTRPGSGHFVTAYTIDGGSTPDPSTWGDALQIYGLGAPRVSSTPASYQFQGCRIDITPLARRSSSVAGWFTPTPDYCSAGVGE